MVNGEVNHEYQNIINFLNNVRLRKKVVNFFEGAFFVFIVLIALITVLVLCDCFFNFAYVLRTRAFIFVIVPAVCVFLFYLVLIVLRRISLGQAAMLIQQKVPSLKDDLINALQLGKTSHELARFYSVDLVDELVSQTTEKVKGLNHSRIIELDNTKKFGLILFGLVTVWSIILAVPLKPVSNSFNRIILPYNQKDLDSVQVYPGNVTYTKGSNLEIIAELSQPSYIKPVLKYRFGNSKWEQVPMEMSQFKKFRYSFSVLNEDMQYRVQWKDVVSSVYQVKIIYPPELGDIRLEYFYPAYTQLPSRKIEHSNGDIEGLLGTRVKINVLVNKPLRKSKLVFSDGQTVPANIKDNTVNAEVYLVKQNKYWFEIEDQYGHINSESKQYIIHIIPDEYPKISFLSPTDDLIVSEKNKLKLTFESSDDFGVKEVYLTYNVLNTGVKQTLLIERYPQAEIHKIEDYDWNLSKLNLNPGDKIEYYLEVVDNDMVSGPKRSISNTLKLEVFSYENEHQKIENELAEFREELLSVLGKQMEAKELTKRIPNTNPNEQNFIWQELGNKQNGVKDDMQKVANKLDGLLDRMNDDPLQDERVFQEYKQISNNMKYLQDQPVKEAIQQINQKQQKNTLQAQEEVVSSLEKMVLLAEDVLEYQRMYDLMSSAQEANDLSDSLNKDLKELTSIDPKKMKELEDTLNKVSELLGKVMKSLTKQQEDLPEEFVNQEGIKKINLSETQDMIQQLNSAIGKGNLEKALEYAKNLMKNLNDMLNTIQTAAKDSVYNEMSSVKDDMKKYSQQLDDLIKEQNSLIDKTDPYEKKRLQEYLKKQEELLKKLAELQKQIVENTQTLLNIRAAKILYPEIRNVVTRQLIQALPKMQNVYNELNTQKLQNSLTLLPEIIQYLQNIILPSNKFIEPNKIEWNKWKVEMSSRVENGDISFKDEITKKEKEYADYMGYLESCINDLSDIKQQEENMLDELKNFDKKLSQLFSEKEMQDLKSLAEEQGKLKQRTTQFNQTLQELSRKTASLESPIFNNLRQASNAMDKASENLSQGQTPTALDKEKEAAYYLAQGKEGMQSAMDQMQQMGKQAGKPKAGFIQKRGGGTSGVHNGFVRLPGKEDYLPAKELRQEVLEGLKEKYPKLYEGMIKEYYKRLTE